VIVGAVLNRRYLRELLTFRGAARRSDPGTPPPVAPRDPGAERLRIR